ncbi:uncharacterized protein CLUP02_10201 [Colletotrichum lupini]|uniref:Uncharacterized protein n=1 Tax=Colletotrichum lupini TaxID=145971 RepID=A0A9Q8SWG0_9PEZI|nr:uncharacterized protein CLUP02_10201 [Colletotrichum lupini]UQC84705.1 hypothetical protein CLUP02_10201 [Colletotrichum lupini]
MSCHFNLLPPSRMIALIYVEIDSKKLLTTCYTPSNFVFEGYIETSSHMEGNRFTYQHRDTPKLCSKDFLNSTQASSREAFFLCISRVPVQSRPVHPFGRRKRHQSSSSISFPISMPFLKSLTTKPDQICPLTLLKTIIHTHTLPQLTPLQCLSQMQKLFFETRNQQRALVTPTHDKRGTVEPERENMYS